jgi:ligand-binding sensor domain-containing protein
LWLATVDGSARFDGARLTGFNKSNSPGIVNNRFVSLFEAAGGDLWAGTEESGVQRRTLARRNQRRRSSGQCVTVISAHPTGKFRGTVTRSSLDPRDTGEHRG